MEASIVFTNVTKKYKMYQKPYDKLWDLVLPNGYGKDFYALQNISFTAEKGDIIGIVGVNGAGKSTLSNLISGVIPPTKGSIKINGDAALISIGAGLNNQLTGRENIELKCLMLGFSKEEIAELTPDIIEFAEIGDFIDQPVKSYSSGMKSRLGFAISVNIDPDILVIDEALSVGDKIFAQKCLDKMDSFKEKGKTIFFISHSIGQVKEFCQKALWLEAGQIKAYGTVEEIIPQYEQFIRKFNKMSKEEKKKFNQQIMEMRSQELQVSENDLSVPRSELSRKKPKHKKSKKAIPNWTLFLLFILVCGFVLFLNWNTLFSKHKNENKMQLAKVEQTKTEHSPKTNKSSELAVKPKQEAKKVSQTIAKDIRYVQVASGYVRNKPDLANSQKVSMLYFGDVITVEAIQKDPVEKNLNWLKFTSSNGRTGWVSEQLATKFTNTMDESSFIKKASQITFVNQLAKDIDTLDTQNLNLGNSRKLNLDIKNQTASQLINQFGQPALRAGQSYLYHGKVNDFIFYSSNSVSFNKLIIKPVVQ